VVHAAFAHADDENGESGHAMFSKSDLLGAV
jgi:hypothetical protein